MNRISRLVVTVGMLVLIFALTPRVALNASDASEQAQIRTLLQNQTEAWNRGDIDAFMAGYWRSEETAFVGASGITRGWQSVLERYKKSYPDRRAMGQLTFSGLEIHLVCADAAFAIGQFQLERENDKPAGIFTLNFRKFPEGWRIVADHTTAFASPAPSTTH
ncbi:MAG TPA: nuclear transport factor 2 family protein [Candidatus Acidoferrales bacterium]|jgi:ketosteroid isomerase-like protein